jgi:Uma2 family endonuclease
MSYDEWWALPEYPRTEWVDGEVIVMGDPHPDHSQAQLNLAISFKTSLPGLKVYPVVAVWLPRNRVRVPDISVLPERPTTNPVELTPVLVVEVLSPSTRTEDTVRKFREYAWAGISQYWLVDTAQRRIDVLELVDGEWEPLLTLDDAHSTGSVIVGDYGTVELDLAAILDD